MSSMPEQREPQMIAVVRQRIERLERELAVLKKTEQGLLALESGEPSMGLSGSFVNLSPYDAICQFLRREGKPQTRATIIRAVIEGGAKLGTHKEKSINQSISTNLGLNKLKEANGLVGLVEWPDEKFQAE